MEKSKIKYILGISIIAVLIIFFGYKKVWNTNVEKAKSGIENFLVKANIKYSEIKTSGFPFKVRIDLSNIEPRIQTGMTPNGISIEKLNITSPIFGTKFNIGFNKINIIEKGIPTSFIKYNTQPNFQIEFDKNLNFKSMNYKDSGYTLVDSKTNKDINTGGSSKIIIDSTNNNSIQDFRILIDAKDVKSLSTKPNNESKNIFIEINTSIVKSAQDLNKLESVNIDISAMELDFNSYALRLDGKYKIDALNKNVDTDLKVEIDGYKKLTSKIRQNLQNQIDTINQREDLSKENKQQYTSFLRETENNLISNLESVSSKNPKTTSDKKYFDLVTDIEGQHKVNGENADEFLKVMTQFFMIVSL